MEPNWTNLARWLMRARGGRSRPDIAAATGISVGTIEKYEMGKAVRGGRKLRQLCEFYGWTSDSLDTVLDGGTPTQAPLFGVAPAITYPPELKEHLAQMLEADTKLPPTARKHAAGIVRSLPEE